MPELSRPRRPPRGFTLAELAVVLVIITLLAGGMLVPLGARMDARNRRDTLEQLDDIEAALIGFAAISGRLPCPSTEPDPASPAYGLEDPAACAGAVEGYLPWRTLGMTAYDAWGSARASAAAPWTGYWRYRVAREFTVAPISAATHASPGNAASNLQILDHAGHPITTAAEGAVAVVWSTGPNRQPDGLNATYRADNPEYEAGEPTARFDDLVAWIGRPLLVARLAQAGRL